MADPHAQLAFCTGLTEDLDRPGAIKSGGSGNPVGQQPGASRCCILIPVPGNPRPDLLRILFYDDPGMVPGVALGNLQSSGDDQCSVMISVPQEYGIIGDD